MYHDTQPIGPRLTASVHFPKPKKKVDFDKVREKMYDWYRWFEAYQREVKL